MNAFGLANRILGKVYDRAFAVNRQFRLEGSRGIVTTFRDNLEFQPWFVDFYLRVWKPDWIISLIGVDSPPPQGTAFGLCEGQIQQTGPKTFDIQYRTPASISGFLMLRQRLFAHVKNYTRNAKILVVDCDEFVTGDAETLWATDSFLSHFVEYVPEVPFTPDTAGLWSEQPYYYRAAALNESVIGVDHHRCKRFDLRRGALGQHAGEICSHSRPDSPLAGSTTFHVGVASREHFLKSKHFDQTVADGFTEGARDFDNLRKKFDQYYARCQFPTFRFRLNDFPTS